MQRIIAFIIFLILFSFQSQPFPAEAGTAIGHPTGRLGNRYFTHPKAADVYLQNRQYQRRLSTTGRRPVIGPIQRRGHIYTSEKPQQQRFLTLGRDELKTTADLDGVLIAGSKKGTKYAQQ